MRDGAADLARVYLRRRGRHDRAPRPVRRDHSPYALFLLDLDRFKHVNDTLGHSIGDQLLAEVGSRLTAAVPPHDVVSRIGGDGFVIAAPKVSDRASVEALANRINVRLKLWHGMNSGKVHPVRRESQII